VRRVGHRPVSVPGITECERRIYLTDTDLPRCAEDGYQVALAEAAAHSISSATIISNFSSFTCIDHDPFESQTNMDAIVDPIIARHSASGRMAIVSYPGFRHTVHMALARAAREGVAVLQFESNELIRYLVDFNQDLVLQFTSNEFTLSSLVGTELCRRWGRDNTKPLRLAALYSPDKKQDIRINGTITGFQNSCPERYVTVVFETRLAGFTRSLAQTYMENALLVDDSISGVLTTSDAFAIGTVAAADAMLVPDRARTLYISGWGHTDKAEITPYLFADRVFATVDDLSTTDNVGAWSSIPKVLDLISSNQWTATTDVQAALPNLRDIALSFSGAVIPSDKEGHVIDAVLGRHGVLDSAYNPEVRPLPVSADFRDVYPSRRRELQAPCSLQHCTGPDWRTVVYVGLNEVVVQEIDVPANTFQATFWIYLQWKDARLTWPSYVYNGTIQLSKERVWTPELFMQNHLSEVMEREAGETLVTVESNGWATWSQKITGEFDCEMRIEPYPFDIHTCYLNLSTEAAADKVVLDATTGVYARGWNISAVPEGFKYAKDCPSSYAGDEGLPAESDLADSCGVYEESDSTFFRPST